MSEVGRAVYLFCLCKAEPRLAARSAAIDGQNPLLLHGFGDTLAVLSLLFARAFRGPGAEQRMQDPRWVTEQALRHERVVEGVMRYSPVLPARFGTLFSSPAKLDQFLKKHSETIRDFLEEVSDKQEWAVKALLDRPKAREWLLARLHTDDIKQNGSSVGTRYMREQRARGAVDTRLGQWLSAIRQEMVRRLRLCSAEFRERPVSALSTATERLEPVLNLAFLVPVARLGEFRARVEHVNSDHAREGLMIRLSGPWPPYSFSPTLGMPA